MTIPESDFLGGKRFKGEERGKRNGFRLVSLQRGHRIIRQHRSTTPRGESKGGKATAERVFKSGIKPIDVDGGKNNK